MNPILSFSTIVLLSLSTAPLALANTTIDISNNADSSTNNVSVHTNTGGNSTSNGTTTGTTKTKIIINGEEVVNDTKAIEGNQETNISVKKEGNAQPVVTYEVKKKATDQSVKAAETKKDIEKKISEERMKTEARVNDAIKKHEVKQATLLTQIESLFSKLRSFFSR